MTEHRTALLSAYNKDDSLRVFAAGLVDAGFGLLASSGTKKFLDGHGVPSTDVADIVGEPILGHRVVTLSREIHAGILARLDNPDDMAELERLGIAPIHLVYVDLYPLADELRKQANAEGVPVEDARREVIEKIDIGGPTLLRAAAKAGRIVVSNPFQFAWVLEDIRGDTLDQTALDKLAAHAERRAALYVALAAEFYNALSMGFPPGKWPAGRLR